MIERLLRGIGANLYGQAVTVLVQLVSLPLLLGAWGPARYGLWTLLGAAPATLAFADGGFVLASGNAMAMLAGRGDVVTASAMYRRAARRVLATVASVGVAAFAVIHLVPADLVAMVVSTSAADTKLALDIMVAVTLLGIVAALPGAALRADGHYALGASASATARLAEAAAPVAVAASGGGLTTAALSLLTARLIALPLLLLLARRRVTWLGCDKGRSVRLASLAKPARAALMLPAGFALGLQGVTLAIGLALTPEAVAAFAAVRTLCRSMVQAAGLVTHALMPEMSRAAGRGDIAAAAALQRLSDRATVLILGSSWFVLMVLGPTIFAAWTGARLALPVGTLPLAVTAALLHGLWLSRANLLLAVNRQVDYAVAFLLVMLAAALAAGLASHWAGLPGAAAATLCGEAVMVARLVRLTRAASLTGVVQA